jgi:hypothetical protein
MRIKERKRLPDTSLASMIKQKSHLISKKLTEGSSSRASNEVKTYAIVVDRVIS